MAVAETSLVQKEPPNFNDHQPENHSKINRESLYDRYHRNFIGSVSTSTVIRKLKEFEFKSDLNHLPEHMSWDEYSFKKGKMSFIAHDYDTRKIVSILDGRTQATIRNHFLRYSRQVRCRVKVITIDMFSPYYDIARKLFSNSKINLSLQVIIKNHKYLNLTMSKTAYNRSPIIDFLILLYILSISTSTESLST